MPLAPVVRFVTRNSDPDASSTRYTFGTPSGSPRKNSERPSGDHCGLMCLPRLKAGTSRMAPLAMFMMARRYGP